ncbi:MAG: hypothetical protein LBV17_01810, partial [Treponema sp.]|nr:hypothetical protein [Treponema sp.]
MSKFNVYKPGCDEHLLIHNIRNAKEFIKGLDYVAVLNDEIIGNIVYVKAKIINKNKEYDGLVRQLRTLGSSWLSHVSYADQSCGFSGYKPANADFSPKVRQNRVFYM